ncbi:hypothetical protein RI367_006721 [Sorochytrium milnesiophthora]
MRTQDRNLEQPRPSAFNDVAPSYKMAFVKSSTLNDGQRPTAPPPATSSTPDVLPPPTHVRFEAADGDSPDLDANVVADRLTTNKPVARIPDALPPPTHVRFEEADADAPGLGVGVVADHSTAKEPIRLDHNADVHGANQLQAPSKGAQKRARKRAREALKMQAQMRIDTTQCLSLSKDTLRVDSKAQTQRYQDLTEGCDQHGSPAPAQEAMVASSLSEPFYCDIGRSYDDMDKPFEQRVLGAYGGVPRVDRSASSELTSTIKKLELGPAPASTRPEPAVDVLVGDMPMTDARTEDQLDPQDGAETLMHSTVIRFGESGSMHPKHGLWTVDLDMSMTVDLRKLCDFLQRFSEEGGSETILLPETPVEVKATKS